MREMTSPSVPTGQVPSWVFGLRPRLEISRWQEVVAAIILGTVEAVSQGAKTQLAEAALGIAPSWYWYISRTAESFGRTVFFWKAQEDGWGEAERGVCPFDTGGLWHRYIATSPRDLDESARTALFAKYDRCLPGWVPTFHGYIQDNYEGLADYILGERPRQAIPEILMDGSSNDSRAWTWEARVRRDLVTSHVRLSQMYCTSEDHSAFLDWVGDERTQLSLPDRKALAQWVEDFAIVCSWSEAPWQRGQEDLLHEGRS